MQNICIFAGTTEGRELAQFLSRQDVTLTVCVATEYGGDVLVPSANMKVSAKRMPPEQIVELLNTEQFDLVVDATHPYAASITESIAASCEACAIRYVRLLREGSDGAEDAVFVSDAQEAARFLDSTDGNILLTTGSKELGKYSGMKGFAERVYARVLPMEASLKSCEEAGLKPSHIIAMQGPFSEELNLAILEQIHARWMVTKDGGDAGGFGEKVRAAKRAGASLVVIGRPPQREGISYAETVRLLCKEYGCTWVPDITITALGPGSRDHRTPAALRAIESAQCLIGARRMLESVSMEADRADALVAGRDMKTTGKTVGSRSRQMFYEAIDPEKIASFIQEHQEFQRFTVLMSGDTGFYSGTKRLLESLRIHGLKPSCSNVTVLPGISSLSYLCAQLGTSYEDVHCVSLHGRERDIAADLMQHPRVFALVGGSDGVLRLCQDLVKAGLSEVKVSVGERLSYPEERIRIGTAQELQAEEFDPLSAVLLERDGQISFHPAIRIPDGGADSERGDQHYSRVITQGLPDEMFRRAEGAGGVIPMTKSEVRAICLSKLQLTEDAVCWDIGAGTGSVAIEMARMVRSGHVYAVEKKEEAAELIAANRDSFGIDNLTVVQGSAPEACEALPAPTHVFVGGSSGNMREILTLVLEKNPQARIVATAIALESAGELTGCLKEWKFQVSEAVQVTVARDRKAGPYHLMMGQNPVTIFVMQHPENRQIKHGTPVETDVISASREELS